MKYFVLVIAATLACVQAEATTPVSFDAAVAAHADERLEEARAAFRRMAENGRSDAQFNLSAMLANGEGGATELVEAALWMSLADEAGYEPAAEAIGVISGLLDAQQRAKWARLLPERRHAYSRRALFERHAPEYCEDCKHPEINAKDRDRVRTADLIMDGTLTLERKAPRYPRNAAANSTVGVVEMGAWLSVDGELEQPHVISSDPKGIFDSNALWAFKRWDFDWQVPHEARSSRYIMQTIEFRLDRFKENYRLERNLRRDLEAGLETIDTDALPAYSAAWTLDFIGLTPDPDRPGRLVEVTYQAARQGLASAQVDLADRFNSGDQVQPNYASSIFWLKQAAFSGDARAQFLLSLKTESLGETAARDFAAAAVAQGYGPALIAEIRRRLESDGDIDSERLRSLVEALPREWRRRNEDDPLMQRARRMTE